MAVDAPPETLVSIACLLPTVFGLEPSISTVSSGDLGNTDLPFSVFLASRAPLGDLNLSRADREPESSDCSAGKISTSTSSVEKTSMRRKESSEVPAGRFRIKADEKVAVAGVAEKGVPTGFASRSKELTGGAIERG